jgi:hypothetical protein
MALVSPGVGGKLLYWPPGSSTAVWGLVTAEQEAEGVLRMCIAYVDTSVDTDHMTPYGFPIKYASEVVGVEVPTLPVVDATWAAALPA